MAITGSGTKQNPYIVHNYTEIKTALEYSGEGKYIQLANDINCNDYGADFEWEAPNVRDENNGTFNFDLGGFTIKNVKVKSGSSMFKFYGGSRTNVKSKIYNGKLLNVFLPNAIGFITPTSGVMLNLTLKNISASVDASSATGYICNSTVLEDSAVYIRSNKLLNAIFHHGYSAGADVLCVKNSDIKIEIEDLNGIGIFDSDYSNALFFITDSRIRGTVGGLPYQNGILWNVPQRHLLGRNVKTASTCVNVDSTSCPMDGTVAGGGVLVAICSSISNLGNAVNKSITQSTYTNTEQFNVTSEEIVNGAALRSAGFIVVNVVGD